MDKIKDGMRLYINITNYCNFECPFCCMYSSYKNTRAFMSFETFKHIIDTHRSYNHVEVQIEGGEPTTAVNDGFFLFVTYALEQPNVDKVIICSNGSFKPYIFKQLVSLANFYEKKILMKISINYYLINKIFNGDINEAMKYYDRLVFLTKYNNHFDIKFNVRLRNNNQDDKIKDAIINFDFAKYAQSFNFQSYGRLKGSIDYKEPEIVQNISDWKLYAHDGVCFDQDLIKRSEYEGGFIK